MVGISDIKIEIINRIIQIDDLDKLMAISKNVQEIEKTGIKEEVTFEQILEEQNYKPISYEEFRAKADKIEWEYTLDELLAGLD